MLLSKEYKVQPIFSRGWRPTSAGFRVQSRLLQPGSKVKITIEIQEKPQ